MSETLRRQREDALALAEATPMPTLRDEQWRYTSLRGIDFDGFRDPAEAEGPPAGSLLAETVASARLIQRGHTTIEASIDAEALAAGVRVLPLERAIVEHPELVERHLGTIVTASDRLTAENAARWEGGALVWVPRGVVLERPIVLGVEVPEEGARTFWRVLVVAEETSSFELVEELLPGEPGLLNGVVELSIGDGADVRYVQVQQLSTATYHFSAQRAEVGRDAKLDWVALAVGGRLGKARMETRLTGSGSSVKVTGVYALDADQHLDLDTTQEHAAPHATSDLAFKGALLDHARSVWRGIIVVEEGAQKTDAFQENRNLLLSPKAHADSIPGLEIKADDVRCTHAATVGQVDRELVFFLQSRGLTRQDAERLIVRGFFAETLERVQDEPLRLRLAATLESRLP